MDYPKSVPNIGLVGGKFVDENQLTGTPGSLIPSVWGNSVTDEVLNVIAASGQAPSEADLTQLVKAIRSLIQANATNYAADTGTANVYAAAFTPPITALTDGTVVRVKIKTANSGASTFNPNGLGAKPIVGSAHAALQGGELVANGHAWLQYNSSLSGGSWVILASSGGAQQVPSASKSAQAVNLSQLGNYNGYLSASANLTLTSTALGKVVFGDATGVVITLPAAQLLEGSAITIVALSDCTVAAAAGGSIRIGSTVNNSMSLLRGEQLTLFTVGISVWYVAAYSRSPTPIGITGQARNLKMSVTAALATASLTADEIVVSTSQSGLQFKLSGFSKAVNLATTGAGGMDTGSAPVSGFVGLYAIYDPVAGATALLATNATSAVQPEVYGGANMPAGYTASALISVWPTDASRRFVVGYQADRKVHFPFVSLLNTTTQQLTLTSLSVAAFVPLNAKTISGQNVAVPSAAAQVAIDVAGSASGIAGQYFNAYVGAGATGQAPFNDVPLISPQVLYYIATTAAPTATFQLLGSAYTF